MPMEASVPPTPLADALNTWAALQGIGKKPSTREYHQEIVGIVLSRWPGPRDDVATVTERTLIDFVLDISEHYSAKVKGFAPVEIKTPETSGSFPAFHEFAWN